MRFQDAEQSVKEMITEAGLQPLVRMRDEVLLRRDPESDAVAVSLGAFWRDHLSFDGAIFENAQEPTDLDPVRDEIRRAARNIAAQLRALADDIERKATR